LGSTFYIYGFKQHVKRKYITLSQQTLLQEEKVPDECDNN